MEVQKPGPSDVTGPVVIPAEPAAPQAPPPSTTTVNVTPTVNVTHNVVVMNEQSGPGFLVRAIWFIFIGWWLSWVVVAVGYLACVTIVGLPLGFAIFNRIPSVLTLRQRSRHMVVEVRDGVTYIKGGTKPQLALWIRAVWFVFVGWWLGALYMLLAWALCVIIITMPFGIWLFDRVGAVMTLLRY